MTRPAPGLLVTGGRYAIWYRDSTPVGYADPVDRSLMDFVQTYIDVSGVDARTPTFSNSGGKLVCGPKLYRGETAVLLYVNSLANALILTPRGLGWSISFDYLQAVT